MARGEGCALFDVEGRRYLDMTAGIAVCVLGHGAPRPGRRHRRAGRAACMHVSNLYYIEAQLQLARGARRGARSAGRVFFCNSGAEANEAALKLARRYQIVTRGQPERTEIVAFENSFHGRTMGALASPASRSTARASGRWSTPVALRAVRRRRGGARRRSPSAPRAVIVEPIQAEGGINLPPPGYLQELRRACTDAGTVLIFDEVQTGVGPHRHVLRVRGRGRRARRRDAGQGAGGRRADRRDAGQRGGRARRSSRAPTRRRSAATRSRPRRRCTCSRRSTSWACSSAAARWAAHLGSALLRLAERRRPQARAARAGAGLLQGLIIDGEPAPSGGAGARARACCCRWPGGNVVRFVPPLIVGKAGDRRGSRNPGRRARGGR